MLQQHVVQAHRVCEVHGAGRLRVDRQQFGHLRGHLEQEVGAVAEDLFDVLEGGLVLLLEQGLRVVIFLLQHPVGLHRAFVVLDYAGQPNS